MGTRSRIVGSRRLAQSLVDLLRRPKPASLTPSSSPEQLWSKPNQDFAPSLQRGAASSEDEAASSAALWELYRAPLQQGRRPGSGFSWMFGFSLLSEHTSKGVLV